MGHIFISYKSSEADFALQIAADLKNSGVNLWMAKLDTGIHLSDDWRSAIEAALSPNVCNGMVAILSPEYVASQYCKNELARADRLGIQIYPVILSSVPETQWPIEIERLQYIDFTNWQEETIYQTNLEKLLGVLKAKFPNQITKLPDLETRYLNKLIAELETRQGVANYVELEAETQKVKTRPAPLIDNEAGYHLLIDTDNSDTKKAKRIHIKKISQAIDNHNQFVLVGDPGSGKTTVIRNIALDLARKRIRNPKTYEIPLLVYLPQWQENNTFDEFLQSKWPFRSNPIKLLKDGELFLFLDGLNEMGAENLAKISELRKWLSKFPQSTKIIITCRADDYNDELQIKNLPTVSVNKLSETQIKQFAKRYLRAHASNFIKQILSSSSEQKTDKHELLQLAHNPYFLTAFMVIYKNAPNEQLPKNSGSLFKKLIQALWSREEQRNSTIVPFSVAEAEFTRLAFAMIDSDMPVDVSREYALLLLNDKEFLKIGQNASFLTIQNNNIRFYHQLIQEYFAAIGLARVGISHIRLDKKPIRTSLGYRSRLYDYDISDLFSSPEYRRSSKWDQVIISLCGFVENPEDIIIRVASFDPLLAVDCLLSGLEIPLDSVIDEFGKTLDADDISLRKAAVIALGRIGGESTIHYLIHSLDDNDFEVRTLSEKILVQLGESVIPYLAKHLNSANEDKAKLSINALSAIGEPAIPVLQDILENGTKISSRIRACTALGRIDHKDSNSLLVSSLNSKNPDLLLACVNGLGNIGDNSSVPALIKLLDRTPETNLKFYISIVEALGNIGSPVAVIPLLKLITNKSWEIHSAALTALRRIGTPEALVPVKIYESLKTRKIQAKLDAIEKLESSYGVIGLLHGLRHSGRSYWEIGSRLIKFPDQDMAKIIAFISDESSNVRAMIAYSIGERNDKQYEKQLSSLLKDKNSFVKGAAIKSVGKLKSEKAVLDLIKLLSDEHLIFSNSKERICDRAAMALLQIRKKNSLSALKKWAMQQLQGRIVSDQRTPIIVLGEIGGNDAIPRLEKVIRYKNPFVSSAAKKALAKIGTPDALKVIEKYSLAEK